MPVVGGSGRRVLQRCTNILDRRTPLRGAIGVFQRTTRLQFRCIEGEPMKTSSPHCFCTLAIAAAVTLLLATPARAQSSAPGELTIKTTAADNAAVLAAR